MGLNVTLVLIGVDIPGSGLLRDGRPDPRTGQWVFPAVSARATRPPPRPTAGSTWSTSTRSATTPRPGSPPGSRTWPASRTSSGSCSAADGMLTGGDMPEYLFRRTRGIVGLLRRLIEDGCAKAIATGEERLTPELLRHRHPPGQPRRPRPRAGEIPDIPAGRRPAASKPRKKRRPRNTVFDDHGASPPPGVTMPGAAAAAGAEPGPARRRVPARLPPAPVLPPPRLPRSSSPA